MATALLPGYFVLFQPLRVLINNNVKVPLLEIFFRDNAITVVADAAGTGTLLQATGLDLAVVLGVPGGSVFLAFAFVMLLSAAPKRFFAMLIALHLGAYVATLIFVLLAGFTTVLLLHAVPLIQYYVLLAASFSILFFSLRQDQY